MIVAPISYSNALLKDNPKLVFSKDSGGLTRLHWAAVYGHKDIAELLLAKGAEVNVKNGDGKTPLQLTSGKGYKGGSWIIAPAWRSWIRFVAKRVTSAKQDLGLHGSQTIIFAILW
jgi:hypothetical protein